MNVSKFMSINRIHTYYAMEMFESLVLEFSFMNEICLFNRMNGTRPILILLLIKNGLK